MSARANESLSDLAASCEESPGYVVFVAYVTPKRDAQGHHLLEFHYRRHQFALEDVKQAVKEFEKHYHREVAGIFPDNGLPH